MEIESESVVIDLLHQPADRLDHPQAVGRLHARPLQAVVEDRVFVGDHVQLRGVAHDLDADVARVLVGEQGIKVVEHAGQNAAQQRQGELGRHQPPEIRRDRLMMRHHVDDGVDDELADGQQGNRQQRDDYADENAERDHRRTGLPQRS